MQVCASFKVHHRQQGLQPSASSAALLENVRCCDAELFNWVLEPKKITVDQAMRCAKREPGRSWEAIESELNKLGKLAEAHQAAVFIPGDHSMSYLSIVQAGKAGKLEVHVAAFFCHMPTMCIHISMCLLHQHL